MDEFDKQQGELDRIAFLQQQAQDDIKYLLSIPQGRRVLRDVVQQSGLIGLVMSDSHASMAYQDGKRSLGRQLLDRIGAVDRDAMGQILFGDDE